MAKCAFEVPLRRLRLEMAWLCAEFKKAASVPTNRQSQLACEMAVIRLYDSWARFCRDAVIISAYGKTTTLSGTELRASSLSTITAKSQVIPVLQSTFKKRPHEPDWERAEPLLSGYFSRKSRNAIHNSMMQTLVSGTI